MKSLSALMLERYGKSSNEQTYATNSLSHVAQLEEENSMLKDKMEKLTNMCETWQEKITMSLCALIISLSTLLQCWKLLMRL
jgi:citrate lyase synthetase